MKHILKPFCIIAFLLCTCISIKAVPTNPKSFVVTQIDGTKVELRFIGDEDFSYYCTMDGVPVKKVDNAYYYATISDDGILQSSGILVHESAERNIAEVAFISSNKNNVVKRIKSTWSEKMARRNAQRMAKVNAKRERRKAFGHPTTYEGKKKGIVILVNYADLKMKSTSTREAWDDQFNKKGYSKNSHQGSVRDYFLDQSYQKLDIEFDVVGPYTVSQGWKYYGKDNGKKSDAYSCQLVSEACKLADPDVNFKDYDWDGDGEVDQVFVVFAGYSAASGYNDDAIWPHEWHISYGQYYGDGNGALKLDGVKVDTYALSSELLGTSGSTMDCIGVAVHEFSHCLGLPDFYDVDGKGTQCMDYWDVLDAGCYSGPNWRGEVPTGYTAYERNFAGWLEYEELTNPCKITGLEDLGTTPHAYIWYNKGNKNEYFILENRQAKNWFKYPVSAHGLFVYHVDYDRRAWENDRPNNDANHPRMTYVPADKSFDRANTGQMVSDFFPGTKYVRSLTNTSHTSCYGKMFNKNSDGTYNTNMELTSIMESAGKISFVFNGGETAVKKELTTLIDQVKAMVDVPHDDTDDGATQNLQTAISNAEDIAENATTSEEYIAAIDTLRRKAVDFLFVANPTDSLQPFDISFCYLNPEITSNEGWKDEVANNGFGFSNNCGEYTNLKYTLSQSSIHKLPVGNYTATVQAFQRAGALETSGENLTNATFFVRLKTLKVKNIVDEAQATKLNVNDAQISGGLYVPSNTRTASYYFNNDLYTNALSFSNTTASGTTVKMGIKCLTAKADYWTCFRNFKLYFHGNPETTIINNIETSDTKDKIYDLSGRKVSSIQSLSRGVYIINGKKVMK